MPALLEQYAKKILNSRVYAVARETPLEIAPNLSARLQNRIFLKREDLQPVFSFKLRGAYNKMTALSRKEQQLGVITASAGNHAQGVALAANRIGIPALIVMPKTTPKIKVDAVLSWNAEVVLYGNTYDDAYEHAMTLVAERKLSFIPPYDDPDVIAGQGTVGLEILKQRTGPIDAVFVPVGGGGLAAGITAFIKQTRPEIKIIAVEPDESPCLFEAMQVHKRVILDQVGIFADGVAVRQIGKEPFRILEHHIDDVIIVNTDEICAAIKDIFDATRVIAEPAGALAVAGAKKYTANKAITGQDFVAIVSGANINFDRLRHVAERAELGEHREALLCATIPEKPGSFRQFCDLISTKGITEFNYRYSNANEAHVFVGVQLYDGQKEKDLLFSTLKQHNYSVVDMTNNEMAKTHIRYMVGGRTSLVDNERLFRFQFPERPGALLRFLNHIGERWNISLFHYRNHGSAYGRVLVGIQTPTGDETAFQGFLNNLGYHYDEETDNPAYQLFLR
ncbi:MAG: threonine ammonia-lyase, biosynthetic [Gammaproteobacteria bacterium]|nr:threonine ammonia-lyase, biosynthetic [Gammaproteobacteria bacterium]